MIHTVDGFVLGGYYATEQMPKAMRKPLLVLVLTTFMAPLSTAQVTGYYRQPDLHGDLIVFSAEGDIWSVSATGGTAHRLTTHAGEESWPYFSPDGSQLAFRASYDGSAGVYVMAAAGGTPRRIDWEPRGASQPVGWTPDGRVIVRVPQKTGVPDFRLVFIDPVSGGSEGVPLSQAAEASVSADGTVFFARMPRQNSNSRWYKGGTAQYLWKYAPAAPEAEPLTSDYPGSSRQPNLLSNGRLYFLSDREGGMNIWSMDQEGSSLTRHTVLEDWDTQELAGDGESLVFRLGADLWTFSPASNTSTKLDITLASDQEQSLVDWETKPMDNVSDADVSWDGKRVALVSRGELFVAPVGGARLVHASRDSGVRYRNVTFTPDSTTVMALSDKSGELEWWRVSIDGIGDPVQVSKGPGMLRQDGVPSPDGKSLVHYSRQNGMWLVDLSSGASTRIAEEPVGAQAVWSPDSRYVVFAVQTPNQMTALAAYDTVAKTTTGITSDRFMENNPVWSADGNWLFFVSSRTWNSSVGGPWGERAPQPHFEDMDKIYALPLREGLTFPLTEVNELSSAPPAAAVAGAVRFDLGHMIRELPIPAGTYSGLMANDKRLFYRSEGDLMALDLEPKAKPIKILASCRCGQLSGDGKRLLVRKDSKYYVIAASSGADVKPAEKDQVVLDDWKFAVNKRDEWTQIYNDAWRLHRDYFWDPNMLGVDWDAMRAKYAPLVERVGSREALADLQGMLVSELSLLHSNAGGGDVRRGTDQVSPAALGGIFERDAKTGGFLLAHRYKADPDLPGEWSPLAHPDARVEEGSIILSINGRSTSAAADIGQLLMDQAGKQVRLSILDPDGQAREVLVTPISGRSEFDLKYHEWEYTRRLQADASSEGAIGYVHLRAMGGGDIGQWTREFYSQTNKQGLIIDVRHNNGGNIDSWVLSQLLRRAWSYFKPRPNVVYPNMQYSFNGHLVVLVDERTASDGEAFADGFRRLGLGQAIGTRTWGGEVWLSGSNRQVDGGVARASETGVYGPEGEWLIEGWGFEPDIVVDNLPHATYGGHDAQLEAAIAHLKALIQQDPRIPPEPPAYPTLIPGSGFPTPWKKQ